MGRVYKFRSVCVYVVYSCICYAKQPCLKLKTRPKQLLGSLPLDIVLAFALPGVAYLTQSISDEEKKFCNTNTWSCLGSSIKFRLLRMSYSMPWAKIITSPVVDVINLFFIFNAWACIIKLITAVIYGFRNKLECLSLNTRLGCKGLPRTNTLACYGNRKFQV